MAEHEKEDSGTLRWFTGVPIVTNPLMALDVLSAAILVFGGALVFIAAGQQFIGDGLTYPALLASAAYAGYLAAAVLAAFLFMGFFVLSNRYAALYRIDYRGVYCETMRGGKALGKGGGYLAFKPFPVEPMSPSKSGSKLLVWGDIHGLQPIASMRVILLKGPKGGTIMKIYCPDETVYQAAVAAIQAHFDEKA